MKKTIIIFLLILLVLLLTVTATYSLVIDVTDSDGVKEIVNEITVRDVFTDSDGNYNSWYYDLKSELNINYEEAEILMDSPKLNENLQIVAESVVDYRANNITERVLTNDELFSLLEDGINNTDNISEELRKRIINKASKYKNDFVDYVYDININVIEG